MPDRSTSYRRVIVSISDDTGTGHAKRTEIKGVAGKPMIGFTVVSLTNNATDVNGLGWMLLEVGDGADPIRVQGQGLQWNAQLDGAGRPIPEQTGLFVSGGDSLNQGAITSTIVAEIYLEFAKGASV